MRKTHTFTRLRKQLYWQCSHDSCLRRALRRLHHTARSPAAGPYHRRIFASRLQAANWSTSPVNRIATGKNVVIYLEILVSGVEKDINGIGSNRRPFSCFYITLVINE